MLGANDYFGELCFLKDRMSRTAWIRAETFVAMWSFDKEHFLILKASNEEARTQIFKAILKKVKNFGDISDSVKAEIEDLLPPSQRPSELLSLRRDSLNTKSSQGGSK